MTVRLFDVSPSSRWRGSKALVPLSTVCCPDCGGVTATVVIDEPQLFRHAGHGATRRSQVTFCAAFCGWGLTRQTQEVRPA